MRRNVFTIPPGAPFLETFVGAFLGGEIVGPVYSASSPLDLARATIYVPTQRAGRALATEFARAIGKSAAILPRILPLGGLDEYDALIFSESSAADFDDALPSEIGELERRLLLAQLVVKWSSAVSHAIVCIDPTGAHVFDESEPFLVASTPAGAYALARDLGALIDDFIIEGIAPEKIDALVEADHDQYWSITTQFLRIALHQWPNLLSSRNLVDAAARRKLLIEAQIGKLESRSAGAPVIAIGSTGAQPATARLLSAISALPNGAVVLAGLDLEMKAEVWEMVGAGVDEPTVTHPQTLLKRLLGVMRIDRDDVREIGRLSAPLAARRTLASHALMPANATSSWREFRAMNEAGVALALADVTAIAAPDERLEALALAVAMREALEIPGGTAALVTPDRNIARRVASELQRFDIEIDDSGGASLASTEAGGLARLIASIGVDGLGAVNAAALLAHPLVCLGRERAEVSALAPLVEIGVLRGALCAEGLSASVSINRRLAQGKRAHPAVRRITENEWNSIDELLRAIEAAVAPLLSLADAPSLVELSKAHRSAFEAVTRCAARDVDGGAVALYELFDRLAAADAPAAFDMESYASLFDSIAFEQVLRGPRRAHPRLKILGPLEARLIEADLVLIAGLDEGVWPPQTDAGAFLNRSMRKSLGLSPPERRIGQSAHDFMMAFGGKRVVLSRAVKRGGAPTVSSRFLARLETLAGAAFAPCVERGGRLLAISAALDRPRENVTIARPAPSPPVAIRPQRLSVTRIERLRRDPYAIFAEYVLLLRPLDPLGVEIGAREMGVAIHEAIANFVARHPAGPLPDDASVELREIAREELADFLRDPSFISFVWPRILAGLEHALDFERERRTQAKAIFIETSGLLRIPLGDGTEFALTAIADRIEIDAEGRAWVFDYKTGKPPTNSQVKSGFAPQLTLEAAMLEAGAFEQVGKRLTEGAAYVGLKDGGATQWLVWKDAAFRDIVAEHLEQLTLMLSQFRGPDASYPSRPFVALLSADGDYDHLARVKEWSRGDGAAA